MMLAPGGIIAILTQIREFRVLHYVFVCSESGYLLRLIPALFLWT